MRVSFGTASAVRAFNLSKLTPKTTEVTPSDGALADDTCVDGILNDSGIEIGLFRHWKC